MGRFGTEYDDFFNIKKLFIAEYCDWSRFKDCSLKYVFLECHWSRK